MLTRAVDKVFEKAGVVADDLFAEHFLVEQRPDGKQWLHLIDAESFFPVASDYRYPR
jgi:hypothetical protein